MKCSSTVSCWQQLFPLHLFEVQHTAEQSKSISKLQPAQPPLIPSTLNQPTHTEPCLPASSGAENQLIWAYWVTSSMTVQQDHASTLAYCSTKLIKLAPHYHEPGTRILRYFSSVLLWPETFWTKKRKKKKRWIHSIATTIWTSDLYTPIWWSYPKSEADNCTGCLCAVAVQFPVVGHEGPTQTAPQASLSDIGVRSH